MKKAILGFTLVMLAVGCRTRLNDERTVSVDLGGSFITIEKIKNAQTVKVAATASTGVFDIFFFLEKDQAAVEKELSANKITEKVLAKDLKVTQANFSVNVPANENAVVFVRSSDGKKADVKVKITN